MAKKPLENWRYTLMKGSMSTDLGIITVNPEVIAKYAGSVAVECFGIVGMAAVNMKDGLVRLLKKDSLTHGIQVEISDDNALTLNFHVIVAYGVNILSVCRKDQHLRRRCESDRLRRILSWLLKR